MIRRIRAATTPAVVGPLLVWNALTGLLWLSILTIALLGLSYLMLRTPRSPR